MRTFRGAFEKPSVSPDLCNAYFPVGSFANSRCFSASDNALLALVAPNLMAKPATVMFNKVEMQDSRQVKQMFGPAERGVAKAVVDSVREGIIPEAEADKIFICVGVFIHWEARDNAKIQDWNYEATKLAISRAIKRTSGTPCA